MTADQLQDCVRAFHVFRPAMNEAHVYLNTESDQVTKGFKLLPNLTADWRKFRRDWDTRLSGRTVNSTLMHSVGDIDEEMLEQGYWEFHRLHTEPCGAPQGQQGRLVEKDAFKYVVRLLIRKHNKEV